MRKNKLTRLIALFLSPVMLATAFSVCTFADEEDTVLAAASEGAEEGKARGYDIADVQDLLNSKSYDEYALANKDVPKGKSKIEIDVINYNADATTAKGVKVKSNYEGLKGKFLVTPASGEVAWDVEIPKTGKYAVVMEYSFPADGKATAIERKFRIDGEFPFKGSRYLSMSKVWKDTYVGDDAYETDINGNDKKAEKNIAPEVRSYTFCDSTGYDMDAYEFVFTEGKHTVSLEATREELAIKSMTLVPLKAKPAYEDYIKACEKKGARDADAEPVVLRAEVPSATSDQTIYAFNDRTSSLTLPSSTSLTKFNAIGSTKWQSVGQWLEYSFDIEEDGFYEIATRFKQSDLSGMYVSRRLYIDDEVPFEEANYLQFNFSDDWQSETLTDGKNENLKFYFEKGTHTIRFEVVLGNMGSVIGTVQESLRAINDDYLKILQITGASPDEYRDYNFGVLIPETIKDMFSQYETLTKVAELITEINGTKGSNVATLENVARILQRMSTDEDEIAVNMSTLKDNIGTLGTWINTVICQPLTFDTIQIQPVGTEPPKAKANFFEAAGFEIGSFFMSFVTDYSNLGATEELSEDDQIEVWIPSGRDQANVVRTLLDNYFTSETNIGVRLKLITTGTLLPATLAGAGPDVSLTNTQDIAVQYAIRNAVLPLEEFDTFDKVVDRFAKSAVVPLQLADKEGVVHTYGLPETQTFPMLFYRKDILSELNVDIPETWDDLMALIPILQYNHMDFGMSSQLPGLELLLYQQEGEDARLYADEGMRVNLDSKIALQCFEDMCEYFTQYSFPVSYDFPNRFRTGEMPLGLADYSTIYNQLSIFATEIKDLWEFVPVIGTQHSDGVINGTTISTITSLIMMCGCDGENEDSNGLTKRDKAWKFMDWFTDTDTQGDYANEMIAIVGQGAMYATANKYALEALPWSENDLNNLKIQFGEKKVDKKHEYGLATIEELPGGYIIPRYVQFAFLNVINNGEDPVDSLLGYVDTINKEIIRKRQEFDLETLELGQTLAEKRAEEKKAS